MNCSNYAESSCSPLNATDGPPRLEGFGKEPCIFPVENGLDFDRLRINNDIMLGKIIVAEGRIRDV
jgi:hypothetical protein